MQLRHPVSNPIRLSWLMRQHPEPTKPHESTEQQELIQQHHAVIQQQELMQRQELMQQQELSQQAAEVKSIEDNFQAHLDENPYKFMTVRKRQQRPRISTGPQQVEVEELTAEKSRRSMHVLPVEAPQRLSFVSPNRYLAIEVIPGQPEQLLEYYDPSSYIVNMPSPQRNRQSDTWAIETSEIELGEKLGEGSFGAVFAARWENTIVAVKQLHDTTITEASIEEFKKEAEVMKRLHSPHIVRFFGYYFESPKYSIVMEYMPKGCLYDALYGNTMLEPAVKYKMIYHIALGVAFLHKRHVIHRDLKSLNIFLDADFNPKLGDYGLASITSQMSTQGHEIPKGTYAWMAPELLKIPSVPSYASDVYAMGITFWEIIARKLPHDECHSNGTAIALKVRNGKRDAIPANCPEGLKRIITQCWDMKPERRPTAKDVSVLIKNSLFKWIESSVATPATPKPKATPVKNAQRWK
jgi:hypothetical protein